MKKLVLLCSILMVNGAYAQKIKYKDLFFLLDTKKYEQAEPLLRQYLSDPKNVDEANPNLQMAFIFQDKADNTDIIENSDTFISYADSAVIYYDKALQLLDEKEVEKKNSEYYQAYQRRDIRTGKFGIKQADVQFDVENKKKAIAEKKEYVREMKEYHDKTLENYSKALELYREIKNEHPSQKILYLRSGSELISKLDELAGYTKASLDDYDSFKSALKKIERSGYNPALHSHEIQDYEKDGLVMINLKDDNIDFYEYDKWAESVKAGVKSVVEPMRLEMVELDAKLDDLASRVRVDSMSMTDRVPAISGLLSKVREYDDDPMPEYLFTYKINDIQEVSYRMDHMYYRDSADVVYQMEVAARKNDNLRKKDSLVSLLVGRNLLDDGQNYKYYIEKRYGSLDQLEAYLKEAELDVKSRILLSNDEIQALTERAQWLVGDQDSIPLTLDVNIGLSKYAPLELTELYTAGLYFSGESPAEGYFAMIDNSREQNLKVNFAIDNQHFSKQTLEEIKPMSVSEEDGHYYYIMFSTQLPEVENYAATIAKIYASDGLAWSKNYKLDTAPKTMLINKNTGDLIIEYDMENYLGADEISNRMVITKTGEIK